MLIELGGGIVQEHHEADWQEVVLGFTIVHSRYTCDFIAIRHSALMCAKLWGDGERCRDIARVPYPGCRLTGVHARAYQKKDDPSVG